MTPFNTGRIAIGSKWQPPQYPPSTSYTEDQVQRALLEWERSANSSRFGGDMRPDAVRRRTERLRKRRERSGKALGLLGLLKALAGI